MQCGAGSCNERLRRRAGCHHFISSTLIVPFPPASSTGRCNCTSGCDVPARADEQLWHVAAEVQLHRSVVDAGRNGTIKVLLLEVGGWQRACLPACLLPCLHA